MYTYQILEAASHALFSSVHAASGSLPGVQISFQGNQAVLPFMALQNLTLSITGRTYPGVDDTTASTWYLNGHRLLSGSRLGPLKKLRLSVFQSLTLENSSILDLGTYEAPLTIDPRMHFISNLGCHRNYYSFVDSTVGADDVLLAQTNIQLKYYGETPLPLLYTALVQHGMAKLLCGVAYTALTPIL